MSELAAVALAASVLAGALVAHPVAGWILLVAGALAVLGVARTHVVVASAALLVLSSGLAARAWDGLEPPRPTTVEGRATLLSDPVPRSGAIVAEARLDGRRVLLVVRPAVRGARELETALWGERVEVRGRLRPLAASERHLHVHHVAARVDVTALGTPTAGSAPAGAANALRRTLERGAAHLGPRLQPLFSGMVYGDDRAQLPEVADDFRGTGLTHLLAVSGQNLAFVLALLGPGLRRLSPSSRLVATISTIAAFALVTRFEPSVLRASVMAAVALSATTLGRPAASVRVLALSVAALVLVDPLLVEALGFQLSAAATGGIVLLAPRIAARVPGPRPLADAVGVTVAAQIGVAPLLLGTFGEVPVASLPANVLVAPLAGAVLVWGLPAGLLAGVFGDAAPLLHLPTSWLLGAVASVARNGAGARLGTIGPGTAGLLVALAVVVMAARGTVLRRIAVVGAVALLLRAAVLAPTPRPGMTELVLGVELWQHDAVVLVVAAGARTTPALAAVREAGVRRVDAVVVGPGSDDALVAALTRRYDARPIHPADLDHGSARFGGVLVRAERPGGDVSVSLSPEGAGAA